MKPSKIRLNEKELKAVMTLRSNDAFNTLLEGLSRRLDESIHTVMYGPDEVVAVERGYSRCLTDLFYTLETASEELSKFNKQT
jgi:S-adenosylmethionine:diacylglycerol 3-amino-3-carboxypropyl transferase